jgi:hypothetical protein
VRRQIESTAFNAGLDDKMPALRTGAPGIESEALNSKFEIRNNSKIPNSKLITRYFLLTASRHY